MDPMDPTGGADLFGGAFGAIFVLFVLAAIGMAAYRVYAARSIATKSGLDPDDATKVTLLEDHGLEATYIAAAIKKPVLGSDGTPKPTKPADRLRELQALLDQGLITQEEYTARRTQILDSL